MLLSSCHDETRYHLDISLINCCHLTVPLIIDTSPWLLTLVDLSHIHWNLFFGILTTPLHRETAQTAAHCFHSVPPRAASTDGTRRRGGPTNCFTIHSEYALHKHIQATTNQGYWQVQILFSAGWTLGGSRGPFQGFEVLGPSWAQTAAASFAPFFSCSSSSSSSSSLSLSSFSNPSTIQVDNKSTTYISLGTLTLERSYRIKWLKLLNHLW